MNKVTLLGRLTKDVELKYTSNQMAVARVTIAIDRKTKEKTTDFIPVVLFDKNAENIEKFCGKGSRVLIEASIQTGSYEKDGQTIFKMDVIGNTFQAIDFKEKNEEPTPKYSAVEEDIPF